MKQKKADKRTLGEIMGGPVSLPPALKRSKAKAVPTAEIKAAMVAALTKQRRKK